MGAKHIIGKIIKNNSLISLVHNVERKTAQLKVETAHLKVETTILILDI